MLMSLYLLSRLYIPKDLKLMLYFCIIHHIIQHHKNVIFNADTHSNIWITLGRGYVNDQQDAQFL